MPNAANFSGSIPSVYDTHFGPAMFEPYARDLAARVPNSPGLRVLEIACGTGIATRHLRERLPASARIVASDLNEGMLSFAQSKTPETGIEWCQADARSLPFDDSAFDVIVCQFGMMFVPDKVGAYAEARRVVVDGGRFIGSVWRATDENHPVSVVPSVLARLMPNPPDFVTAIPHGYHDKTRIALELRDAGWSEVSFEDVSLTSESASAAHLAHGLVCGTPLRFALDERGLDLPEVERELAAAFAGRSGDRPLRLELSATVVTAVA